MLAKSLIDAAVAEPPEASAGGDQKMPVIAIGQLYLQELAKKVYLGFENVFSLVSVSPETCLELAIEQLPPPSSRAEGICAIVLLDGESSQSVELGLACLERKCIPIVLIQSELHPNFLEDGVDGLFKHFIAVDGDGLCEILLTSVFKRYLRAEFFGLSHFRRAESSFRRTFVRNSEDRVSVRDSLIEFIRSFELGLGRSLDGTAMHAASVQEEFIMNAIWDANPLLIDADRRVFPNLETKDAVEIEWAKEGHFLVVSVSDPFGSFPLEILSKYRDFLYSKAKNKMVSLRTDGEGAGIGIFMVLKRVGAIEVTLQKGVRTQMVAYFNLKLGQKQSSRQIRSFQNFVV